MLKLLFIPTFLYVSVISKRSIIANSYQKQFFINNDNVRSNFITFTLRSSHRRCYLKKGVLKNFAKFKGKHLCQSLFFNKVAGLSMQFYQKRGSDTICTISKNTFFTEHLRASASVFRLQDDLFYPLILLVYILNPADHFKFDLYCNIEKTHEEIFLRKHLERKRIDTCLRTNSVKKNAR